MTAPPPLRPERVRAIVFDLDGTLVDSYAAIAASLNHARGRFGMEPLNAAEVRRRVGRGLETLISEVIGEEHVEEGVRAFREHYALAWEPLTFALPGASTALRELHRRGYRLGVATNKPARFAGPILDRLALGRFLDTVEGPDTAGGAKPDPVMLSRCLSVLGSPADESLYVGDMVLDVETASRAGVPVILVPGGSSPRDDLLETGQRVIDSILDLLDVLPKAPSPRRALLRAGESS